MTYYSFDISDKIIISYESDLDCDISMVNSYVPFKLGDDWVIGFTDDFYISLIRVRNGFLDFIISHKENILNNCVDSSRIGRLRRGIRYYKSLRR